MDGDKSREDLCDKDDQEEPQGAKQKYFGIKSYLHNFYENVSVKNPNDYEECDGKFETRNIKGVKRPTLWTTALVAGLISMLCGAILLLVGFTYTRMKIDIGYQEEMRIIDKSAYEFNQRLDQVKVLGLVLFAVGGILVASTLLLPSLTCGGQDENQEDSTHFKLCINSDNEIEKCTNRRQNLIPVTEKLKVIQPKQENKTIITNSGLKQIDVE